MCLQVACQKGTRHPERIFLYPLASGAWPAYAALENVQLSDLFRVRWTRIECSHRMYSLNIPAKRATDSQTERSRRSQSQQALNRNSRGPLQSFNHAYKNPHVPAPANEIHATLTAEQL